MLKGGRKGRQAAQTTLLPEVRARPGALLLKYAACLLGRRRLSCCHPVPSFRRPPFSPAPLTNALLSHPAPLYGCTLAAQLLPLATRSSYGGASPCYLSLSGCEPPGPFRAILPPLPRCPPPPAVPSSLPPPGPFPRHPAPVSIS